MKKVLSLLFLLMVCRYCDATKKVTFYRADHPYIQYTGRADFSNAAKPKLWASGVYVQIKFKGTYCELQVNDEMLWGNVLNYLEIMVDKQPPHRVQLKGKENTIVLAKDLLKGEHDVIICKNTESENGYIEMVGITCEELLPPPSKPKRKMEFIGDSITCGFGADESEIKCGDKNSSWYDQHNAWLAYGPSTARNLNAQWYVSAISGIGLIHSCCDKKIVMPQVYDQLNMSTTGKKWDFSLYQPDVVTVCLGQNDGVQDSVQFCTAYIKFAKTLRSYYPKARLIFLTSPMADAGLKAVLVKYIMAVKTELNRSGDQNIGYYFFTNQSIKGCGNHPSLAEQKEIADELTAYVKKTMRW